MRNPHADQTAVGELDRAAGVHVARVYLLLAGDGGCLRGGSGQADKAGIAQRLGFGGQRNLAEHLNDTGRGNERVLLGDLVGPLPEGSGVIGQGQVRGDQGVSADAAEDVLGLFPEILGFDGRAGHDTRQAAAAGFVFDAAPGGQQGLAQFSGRHDAAIGFEQSGDLVAQRGDGGILQPARLGLGENLADAAARDASQRGNVALARPDEVHALVEPEQRFQRGGLRGIAALGLGPQDALRTSMSMLSCSLGIWLS